ncbi:MAG: peptide chain release factor N(5)-glutamine methyltransferase [Anaerocolumna sp.]
MDLVTDIVRVYWARRDRCSIVESLDKEWYRMKTLAQALKEGSLFLSERNVADASIDSWLLLSFCCKIDRATYFMNKENIMPQEEYDHYMQLILLRSEHIPLQHLTGEQEFMGLTFYVNEDVLIPRQDTEILVEEILKVSKGKRILDVCTGSGCILISLDKLSDIESGLGVDLSKRALLVAQKNGKTLDSKVTFMESDMYSRITGTYDIIVSNPPYIPSSDVSSLMEEVRVHEPMMALDGKEDGLYFYKVLCNRLKEFLVPGGFVFFEIGYNQGKDVTDLLKEAGMSEIKITKDLAGLDRVVSAQYKKECEEPFT